MKYKTIQELSDAIDNDEIDTAALDTFNCKRELYVVTHATVLLFSAYYGTDNAVNDICWLLGLPEPEKV